MELHGVFALSYLHVSIFLLKTGVANTVGGLTFRVTLASSKKTNKDKLDKESRLVHVGHRSSLEKEVCNLICIHLMLRFLPQKYPTVTTYSNL